MCDRSHVISYYRILKHREMYDVVKSSAHQHLVYKKPVRRNTDMVLNSVNLLQLPSHILERLVAYLIADTGIAMAWKQCEICRK
jgi:hypothetical protein